MDGNNSSSAMYEQYMNEFQLGQTVNGVAPTAATATALEKKKRGRPPRNQATAVKPPPLKKQREEEEDVCFICFDGGSLVLCDRKSCPKAYHPACIKRDEAFFRSKAKWTCGWHICSVCQKASHYLCYTCTYSLCKACTKNADYLCVRGNKGFCSTCMKTIMLIENKDQANKEMVQVDFDDKDSWEYLFKVYWVILKEKLSLTLDELVQAKNPWKESDAVHRKRQLMPCAHYVANDGKGIAAKSLDHLEMKKAVEPLELSKNDPPTNRAIAESNNVSTHSSTPQSELTKPVEELEFQNEDCSRTKQGTAAVHTSVNGCMEWASKELLDFVAHMKDGDTSARSQFDVQALLLDYIKRNNLRDPRQKSQIICDLRLKSLFGKPRVGHIEMLKLLEFHFLIKESEKSAFIPAGIVGTVTGHVKADDNSDISSLMNKNKKRKTRKNGEVKTAQVNLDEYAAIDAHNINFIYLRRELMENLAEDVKFHDRVVGSVVRIRIPGNDQKQEIYRLVHVVGTSKSSEPYKIRDKTVDVLLEVLNLDKKESASIDSISNQDFCEDECRRLRQSIKCGLGKQLTVGDIQKKAMDLRAVKLNDSLEAEILRLNHLRDRASEKGHKKELRECIEKLELLKTPEERQRRLLEIPEVNADPKMGPNYESEGDDGKPNDKRKVDYPAPRCTRISRRDEKLASLGSLVKEEGSMMAQSRMSEKRETCGTNILDKLGNQLTVDQAVDRSGSEASIATVSTANSSCANSYETNKLWHYRDPAGRIQGPFSVIQLRKWNTSGLFPPDMRIWTNHEHDDSILLTNALKGIFHTAPQVHGKTSNQSQEAVASNRNSIIWSENAAGTGEQCGKREAPGHLHNSNNHLNGNTNSLRGNNPQCLDSLKGNNPCSDKPQMSSPVPSSGQREVVLALPHQERGHENDKDRSVADHVTSRSRGNAMCQINDDYGHNTQSKSRNLGQSAVKNQGSFTSNRCSNNLDSGSSFASATKSSDSLEQKGKMNLPDLPSPTPETSYGELEAEAAEKLLLLSSVIPVCASDIHDLPSPTPNSNREAQDGRAAENKESVPSSLPVQESGRRWSSASSLVTGGAQLREVADELGTSSPAAKPATEESDSGLVSVSSLKPAEAVSDHVATPASNADQLPAKPSTEEWDSGPVSVSSLKRAEAVSDHVATPASNADQLTAKPSTEEWGSGPVSFSPLKPAEAVGDHVATTVSNADQLTAKPSAKESDSGPVSVSSLKPAEAAGDHVATPASNADQLTAKLSAEEWDSGPVSISSLKPSEAVIDHVATPTSNTNQLAARPSAEEWDSGLVSVSSLKPAEAVGNHVATPTSNANQLNDTSPSHPVLSFFGEPIEAEESVSDLLAEVDAMESLNQNGMGSPTSAMRCSEEMISGCKNDCFSPIEELSPAHDPVKIDALSSTGDLQLPCQSNVTDERVGASTSSEGETKSTDVLFSQGEAGSNIPAPCTTREMTSYPAMGHSTGLEGMNSGHGAAPGNMSWSGPSRVDAFDPLERSSGNSSTSTEGETKSADVLFSQAEARSNIPAPCTRSETTAYPAMGCSTGLEGMNSGRGAAPGNISWSGPSRVDAFDPLKRSSGNSSTSSEGETKSADVLFSQAEARSNIPAPCSRSETTAHPAMGRSTGLEGMNSGRGAAPGNMTWSGPVQGYANVGLGMNRGAPFTGNAVWDSQRRYAGERSGGPRDWAHQGGDSGFDRGRSSWNRQQPYGGGGYSRPPPRGHRICKFYESGRCKKGASCDYLHP